MEKEDRQGIGQQKAEKILYFFMTLKQVFDNSMNYRWSTGRFGRGWFVKSPIELVTKAREVIDWGVSQFTTNIGRRFDLESPSLSAATAQEFQRLVRNRH
jgi:hypothetical protein